MTIDEPELTPSRPGEHGGRFMARLGMLDRLTPKVRHLLAQEYSVIVESDRRPATTTSLQTDVVVEFGDLRVRLAFAPGLRRPFDDTFSAEVVGQYLLEVADADAVAVVADDDELTCWLFTLYDAHGAELPVEEALAGALDRFFHDNTLAIQLPDLRAALALPSPMDLRSGLHRSIALSLESVTSSKARIEEKVAALALIGDSDIERLVTQLSAILGGGQGSVDALYGPEGDPK